MKAVQLLIKDILPDDIQDDYVFDKASMNTLTSRLAAKHPDAYSKIIQQISDIGRHAAYYQGETLTLEDFKPVIDKDAILAEMDMELKKARIFAKTPQEIKAKQLEIYANYSDKIQDATIKASLKQGNNLGNTILSGARGKPDQLKAMVSTPALYTDYNDKPIPLFVRKSFGQGLAPHEYLASTFGARKATIAMKTATAQAGDLGKQLVSMASPIVVTETDCETSNGLDLDLDDTSNKGRVLTQDVGGIKAGTIVDRDVLQTLRKKGVKKLLARSPLTCQTKGGVCSKCIGADPRGNFKPIGYAAGVTAGTAIAEPLAQSGLNTKHSGGMAQGGKKTFSGFKVLNQFVQAPSTFPDKATVSELDGKVEHITDAPQGGQFVEVNGEKHYVLPGMEINVKPGEMVERGDQLSDGVINVADIIRLRGLGEGRRVYAQKFKEILDDSGLGTNAIHAELIARGAINHVEVDEGTGAYLPGDIVQYNDFSTGYKPSEFAKETEAKHAEGKYLESPALHYSIGTQLTPSMLGRLQDMGMNKLLVSDRPPDFMPMMRRLRTAPAETPSWLQQMSTSYIKTNIQDAAMQGMDSNTGSSQYFADTLAKGTNFAKDIETTGKF